VNCVASNPVCDPSLTGVCPSGPNVFECCDVASNCADDAACVGAQKVCVSGDFKSVSCLNDGQCPNSVCRSTGRFCNGGDFDGFSCVDDADCSGAPPGTCDEVFRTPTPTVIPTPTPSRSLAALLDHTAGEGKRGRGVQAVRSETNATFAPHVPEVAADTDPIRLILPAAKAQLGHPQEDVA